MNKQNMPLITIFLEKIKRVKKTDWLALALAGGILLILAMPGQEAKEYFGVTENDAMTVQAETGKNGKEELQLQGSYRNKEDYTFALEERLEEVLHQMEGVGEVRVMITISDYGEYVVEKDITESKNTVTENVNGENAKTSVAVEVKEQTIHVEEGNETYPYVGKEILPTIEGVVVVAEGGGNATVASDISRAVMALFPVEAHKIIVVKMSDKGD